MGDISSNRALTKSQEAFLDYCERFGWGRVELWETEDRKLRITVKDGEPVFMTIIERDTKLD